MADHVHDILPRVDCLYRSERVRTSVTDFRADFESDRGTGGRVTVTVDLDAALARRAAGQAVDDPVEAWKVLHRPAVDGVSEDNDARTFNRSLWPGLPLYIFVLIEGKRLAIHIGYRTDWDTTPDLERPILTIDVDRNLAHVKECPDREVPINWVRENPYLTGLPSRSR